MQNALQLMRTGVESETRHAFVLTQNVKDDVWLTQNQRFNFASGLARAWSQPGSDGRPSVVAKYSLSQGIVLYRNGEPVIENNDPLVEQFDRLTGLGFMLVLRRRTHQDMAQQARDPAEVLPPLYPFLASAAGSNSLLIDSSEYLIDGGRGHGGQLGDRVVLELLLSWARDRHLASAGAAVIMLCSELGNVPPDLIRGDGAFQVIPVEYPNVEQRREFLVSRDMPDAAATRFANVTTGFRRVDLDEVLTRNLDEASVAKRKAELIVARCGDTVELVTSDHGLDLANAQPHVRDYLLELRDIILADRRSILIPMGLLFVGVPGNGKSHLARAFAHDCGMNMLRFKNLRSMWVGESERNLETVLDLLPSLAPSVVFVDEVDQMLGARGERTMGDGGSQVEARLLGRLLDFMGDSSHRGDIIWIGATNRPDLLDIAALRRFDRIFPFMNPTRQARTELVNDLVTRLGIPVATGWSNEQVAALMDDFGCDEVEKVIRRAYEISAGAKETSVALDHVQAARGAFKHNYNPLMHEFIALLSIQGSNFLSDLPWFDQQGRPSADTEMPSFMTSVVDAQGVLDPRLLGQQIDTIRQQLRTR